MQLRPELMFPPPDEEKVARLSSLAAGIDGARQGEWEEDLAEFNREAGTDLSFGDFQGICEGQEHETWVRWHLATPYRKRIGDITRAELVETARRVLAREGEEHENNFWLDMLALNVPDPRVSDLIYWPGEYFGDGDNARELTPDQVVDIASARARGGSGRG